METICIRHKTFETNTNLYLILFHRVYMICPNFCVVTCPCPFWTLCPSACPSQIDVVFHLWPFLLVASDLVYPSLMKTCSGAHG